MTTPTIDPGRLFVFDRPIPGSPPNAQEMINLLTALARNNYTTDHNFPSPATARDGMFRVNAEDPNNIKGEFFISGSWRVYVQHIENGIAVPAHLEVSITAAASPWVIDHNLGVRPLVQAYDASGNLLAPVKASGSPALGECKIQHVNANRVGVTLDAPATGFVILIG